MSTAPITPGNDLIAKVYLEDVTDALAKIPATTGTVDSFVSLAKQGENITPADDALVATVEHVGVETPDEENPEPLGTWSIRIPGEDITPELLDTLSPDPKRPTPLYLIVKRGGAILKNLKLKYTPSLALELVED